MAANDPIKTVVIVSAKDPNQQEIINEMDYDPSKHTLWDEREAAKAAARKEPDKFMSPERHPKAKE